MVRNNRINKFNVFSKKLSSELNVFLLCIIYTILVIINIVVIRRAKLMNTTIINILLPLAYKIDKLLNLTTILICKSTIVQIICKIDDLIILFIIGYRKL
jgi:hypothetical protein